MAKTCSKHISKENCGQKEKRSVKTMAISLQEFGINVGVGFFPFLLFSLPFFFPPFLHSIFNPSSFLLSFLPAFFPSLCECVCILKFSVKKKA